MTLAAKIAAASKAVGGKLSTDKTNNDQNYNYLSADKILSVCGQALADQGLAILPTIEASDIQTIERGQGKYRYDALLRLALIVTDGETTQTCNWLGMGSDYLVPDKAVYKAMTSGHKYFVMKLLNVGANNEDGEHEPADEDGDSPHRTVARQTTRTEQAGAAPRCPKCNGPMWDNRAKIADGNKGPEWACKASKWNPETKQREGCDGVYWPGQWPPRVQPSETQIAEILGLVKRVYTAETLHELRDHVAQEYGVDVATASSVKDLIVKLTPAQADNLTAELLDLANEPDFELDLP